MGLLVVQRLIATVPVLFLVTAGVFALIHLTPGDPIDTMMAESVDATVKATLRAELGLDRPLYIQYGAWMARVLQGDLGRSIRNREPVIENVGRRIRPSLELAALAMAISVLVAFPIGIASAARRHSAVDGVGTTFSLFGICMPNFLLALVLIFVFGVTLRWLPISGYTDPFEEPLDGLRSLALPAITLGLALAAVITRTLRSSMLEALAGLRPHRAGEGAVGVEDHPRPRPQERAHPRRHRARAPARHAHRGRRDHGVRLRPARRRAPRRRRRLRSRLPARAGRRSLDRRWLHPEQSVR
jgi:ABC-type dipeptide/oligopeptide/nickel transport system permease component